MNIEGKVWGETSLIFRNSTTEVHRIVGKIHGYCSEHHHEAKHNMFFVERGELLVRIWRDNGVCDETTLFAGESISVEPGLWHQFEVKEDETVAYEIYWVELEAPDIVRRTQGGVKPCTLNP